MDTEQFKQELAREGYEVVTKKMEANVRNEVHTHPFDVRLMVLSGEMSVAYEGRTTTCHSGDTFAMRAGCEHAESYGPEGATYLVGRRQVTSAAA